MAVVPSMVVSTAEKEKWLLLYGISESSFEAPGEPSSRKPLKFMRI